MNGYGLTDELIEHVKREEGWSAKPYLCPAGKWTIGYGRQIPKLGPNHPPITLEEGEAMLIDDLKFYRDCALSLSPGLRSAPEHYLAAITDFCYNAGPQNYRISTLRKRVNAENWTAAAQEMRRWVYATDPKTGEKIRLRGLVRRRETVAKWLETPPSAPDDTDG